MVTKFIMISARFLFFYFTRVMQGRDMYHKSLTYSRRLYFRRLRLIVLFALSLALVPHMMWLTVRIGWYPFKCYLQNLPFMILVTLPAFLPGRAGKIWLTTLYVVLVPLAVAMALHLALFQTNISDEMLSALLDTNGAEAGEALGSYISIKTVSAALGAIVLPLIPLVALLRMPFLFYRRTLAIVALLCVGLGSNWTLLYNDSFLKTIGESWSKYRTYKAGLEVFAQGFESEPFQEVEDVYPGVPRTIVVVIGESANRHHLGIYGYFRDTTPCLNALRDELLVFTDVVSRYGFTASNHAAMLSVPVPADGSILPLMSLLRQAGFQTNWLSTQNTFWTRSTFNLIHLADKVYGDNVEMYWAPEPYDKKLLPRLAEILAEPAPTGKRLLFINIMGSHVQYKARYPENFESIFYSTDDIPSAPWRTDEAKYLINTYDSSIAYTDSLLGDIIEQLRDVPNSALLYLSDHGEEVYDTRDYMGHDFMLSSRHIVDIPFLLWISPSYRNMRARDVEQWRQWTERPSVSDTLCYILADLAGYSFALNDRSKSLLSVDFQPAPRVLMGEDYDLKFSLSGDAGEQPIPLDHSK